MAKNKKSGNRGLTALVSGMLLLLLASCGPGMTTDFPVRPDRQKEQLPENVTVIQLDADNIAQYRGAWPAVGSGGRLSTNVARWQYRVGVGDVLSVIVWDHPELTSPEGGGTAQAATGISVKANGDFFYPYVKDIRALGRSVSDIQQDLTTKLARFIPDPQVEVKVAQYNSKKVVVTGAVAHPGALKITNLPLTLIEAVNASGGLAGGADSRRVSIQRQGQRYYVDLRALLEQGRAGYNPVLRGGDIVNVPPLDGNVAFILGKVHEPGPIDLGLDGISLTQAISEKGGLDEDNANPKGVFVFRARNAREGREAGFDVFQLDATTPLAFVLGAEFVLHPQDVVYVVSDPAAKWNDLIAALVPTLTAVRAAQVVAGGL